MRIRLAAALLVFCSIPLTAQNRRFTNPDIDSRVEALLRRMTLDDKVGQLNQLTTGYATGPGGISASHDELLAAGQIGSLFNATTALQTNTYQKIAVEKSRSDWRPPGMSIWWSVARARRRKKRQPRECAGRSHRWWTLRGMRAGDE
jgi:hypothetical protein